MGFLGLLILSFEFFAIAYATEECVAETAQCAQHWVKVETHKNLMESEEVLNTWCSTQGTFYSCLENVFIGDSGNLSGLPTNLLISKMFAADFCTEGSHSRIRYLEQAECINQLDNDYCTEPEYLEIVTQDEDIPLSRCSAAEKTFSCIAATMVMNCGFDAARVYRFLLKLTRYGDEICGVDSSEGVPVCNRPVETPTTQVIYDLVDRFGLIPEQGNELDEPEVYSHETTKSKAKIDSAISEAIGNALDAIEESGEEYEIPQADEPESLDIKSTEESSTESEPDTHKKTPHIAEPFKGLLFYNFSGIEYAIYWRQPEPFPLQQTECTHLLPSFLEAVVFRCLMHRRMQWHEPLCLAGRKIRYEKITPELIRDIDPDVPEDGTIEFGPRPFWMDELDGYKKEKELREKAGDTRYLMSAEESDTDSTEIPTEPTGCRTDDVSKLVLDPNSQWWKCHNIFSPALRTEIVSVLAPEVTEKDIPLMSVYYTLNIAYAYVYETAFHKFENVTCSRVNECHPRGRDVFKCTVFPRVMRKCDNCREEKLESSPAFDNLRHLASHETYAKPRVEKPVATMPEGSGSPEDEASSENLITLLIDNESVTKAYHDSDIFTEELIAEDGVLQTVSSVPSSEMDSLPNVRIVLFEDEESAGEHAFLTEDAMNSLEKVYGLPEDEDAGMMKEVFVLKSIPSDSSVATYEIIDPPVEKETSINAIDEVPSSMLN